MRAQGHGRILQNSSILGFTAMRYRGAYNATKFAIEGITDTMRMELRGSGVQMILIEPVLSAQKFVKMPIKISKNGSLSKAQLMRHFITKSSSRALKL